MLKNRFAVKCGAKVLLFFSSSKFFRAFLFQMACKKCLYCFLVANWGRMVRWCGPFDTWLLAHLFSQICFFSKRGRRPNLTLMVLMRMGEWGRVMAFARCRLWCGNVIAFSFSRVRARYIRYAFVGETW